MVSRNFPQMWRQRLQVIADPYDISFTFAGRNGGKDRKYMREVKKYFQCRRSLSLSLSLYLSAKCFSFASETDATCCTHGTNVASNFASKNRLAKYGDARVSIKKNTRRPVYKLGEKYRAKRWGIIEKMPFRSSFVAGRSFFFLRNGHETKSIYIFLNEPTSNDNLPS